MHALLVYMHKFACTVQAKIANLHACRIHALNYCMHAFILQACTRNACMQTNACTLCMPAHAGKMCVNLHACTTCMQHACNSLEGKTLN